MNALGNNILTGSIPGFLGEMESLEELDLSKYIKYQVRFIKSAESSLY